MSAKKILYTFLIVFFGISLVYADSRFVIIYDTDGYTNLRDEPKLNIINKIPTGTVGTVVEDFSPYPSYLFFITNDSLKENRGQIHQSRLRNFANKKYFKKIPMIQASKTQAVFDDKNIKIRINLKKYSYQKKDFACLKKLDTDYYGYCDGKTSFNAFQGKRYYGSDGAYIPSAYLYESITLKNGNNTNIVPKNQFTGYFIPTWYVNNDMVFGCCIEIYQDKITKNIYIFSTQAHGGAMQYSVVFEFDKNGFVRQYAWLEAI